MGAAKSNRGRKGKKWNGKRERGRGNVETRGTQK